MNMFGPDFSNFLPPICTNDGNIIEVEEWKSSTIQLVIRQEAFLNNDGSLDMDRFNKILDDMFKIENECIKFIVDTKAITDSRWDK